MQPSACLSGAASLPAVPERQLSDKQRFCTLGVGPLTVAHTESTAWTLLHFNCHCHFSSPNSLAVSYSMTSILQTYTKVFLID